MFGCFFFFFSSFRCLGRGITITVSGCVAHVCLYSFQCVSNYFLFFFGFSVSFFILPFSTILKLAVSGKCYLSLFFYSELFCWTGGFAFAVFGVCSFGYFVTYFGGVFTDFVFSENLQEMGVISRKLFPACESMCVCCPALRSRSRQPVKRYKKLLAEIFPKSLVSILPLLLCCLILFSYFVILMVTDQER
jgi:hypothetical protein